MTDLTLKPNYLIERSIQLNKTITENRWTITECRFLDAYLAKIDARYPSTRRVRFSLEEFKGIFELTDSDVAKPSKLKPLATKLIKQVVVEDYSEGDEIDLESIKLFRRCKIMRNNDGAWVVDIEADNEAMPFMFDIKEYFSSRLGIVSKLDTVPKRNLYYIIKQGEYVGELIIPLKELLVRVCGKNSKYNFNDFKRYILDKCKVFFEKECELFFEYERIKGAHNATKAVRFFNIKSNDLYRQIAIDMDAPIRIVSDIEQAFPIAKLERNRKELEHEND